MPRLRPDEVSYVRTLAIECAKDIYTDLNGIPCELTDDEIIHCILKGYTEVVQNNADMGDVDVLIMEEMGMLALSNGNSGG